MADTKKACPKDFKDLNTTLIRNLKKKIEELKESEEKIVRYNNHLEELVEERTEKLRKQNVELVRKTIELAEMRKELEDRNIQLTRALKDLKMKEGG